MTWSRLAGPTFKARILAVFGVLALFRDGLGLGPLTTGEVQTTGDKEGAPAARATLPFEGIFDEHLAYVTTALGRLGVPKRDLADVAHEVFLQVFRNLDVYDPSRPLRPWLFGIAYRAASNHRRRAHRRLELVDSSVELGATASPGAEQQLIQAEERMLLESALREVELERRAVLILHAIEGRRITEIAKTLGLPLNTAYSRLRLARREFESAVKRLKARGLVP